MEQNWNVLLEKSIARDLNRHLCLSCEEILKHTKNKLYYKLSSWQLNSKCITTRQNWNCPRLVDATACIAPHVGPCCICWHLLRRLEITIKPGQCPFPLNESNWKLKFSFSKHKYYIAVLILINTIGWNLQIANWAHYGIIELHINIFTSA